MCISSSKKPIAFCLVDATDEDVVALRKSIHHSTFTEGILELDYQKYPALFMYFLMRISGLSILPCWEDRML